LAIQNEVDLILTHHWIFWWIENVLTDIYYEKISKLIKNDIWLYACHLPLDAHPVVWNNIWILVGLVNILNQWKTKEKMNKILNNFENKIDEILDSDWIIYEDDEFVIERFWNYRWTNLGYWLKFKEQEFHWTQIISPFAEIMWFERKFYNFWKNEYFKSVAIVSGEWWSFIKESRDKNYDILITGEAVHWQITFAKEIWQSILIAWHRETEKIWPKLLAYYLKKRFDLEVTFLDEKY
jgi:putative NIF3 family GTP cyclohydrolase 1 type 2